jgi:hypothetical protein
VTTIFLVSYSWGINLKFGMLVLFVHDVSDIGIDLLKMCNYCDYGWDDVSGVVLVRDAQFCQGWVGFVFLRLCAGSAAGPR